MNASLYSPADASGIWVHLEHADDRLAGVSRELLAKARDLADQKRQPLTGLLMGEGLGPLADEAISCGADLVLLAQHPLLEPYTTDPHARVAGKLILEEKPDILLLGATPNGRDLAGRLAVRLRTGLTADCTDLTLEPETGLLLVGEVTGFGGGIVATIKCKVHRPQMATVRPGVFVALGRDPTRSGEVRRVPVTLTDADARVRVLERRRHDAADLTQADVLVVGGAGTRGEFAPLRELAQLLGAELGVTRVAVDAGWATIDRQIGQTGVATRPKLAIVCGASGALQFTVGIEAAETVVAVNVDGDAPIFESADFGVVGDLFKFVPALAGEIRAALSNGNGRIP